MKHKVSWGIIGCGDVAEVKSGPAFQRCESSQLLAVMRRNIDLAKDFANRHNVPIFYDDADQLINNPEINAVYVATPPSTHLEYATKALQAGKNVYLEKAMVLNATEAKTLQKLVKESPNKLVVAHYRRFLPLYVKVKELIDNQTIGNITWVDLKFLKAHDFNNNAKWRLNTEVSGGGFFHDLAPHQIDLMIYFFGEVVSAKGISVNQARLSSADDLVNGVVQFKNNIMFRGLWHFASPKDLTEDCCTIYGEKGSISFSFYEETLTLNKNNTTQVFNFENPKHIQQPLIQETVNYFLGKRDNPCNVEIGATVINIMEQFTKN